MAAKRTWLTPYNFVSNNPLLRVDPDGNLDICETCPNEPWFDEYRDSPVNYEFTPNGNGGGEIHVAYKQTLEEVNVSPTIGPQMVASNGNYNGFNFVTSKPGYLFGQGKETRKGEVETINIDNFILTPPGGNSLSSWLGTIMKAADFASFVEKLSSVNFDDSERLYSSQWIDSTFVDSIYINIYNPKTGEIEQDTLIHRSFRKVKRKKK